MLDENYILDDCIDTGADSRVYRGHKKNDPHEIVAIKAFRSKDRFDREKEAFRLVGKHPNIILYKDAGLMREINENDASTHKIDGKDDYFDYCIVLEYIVGGSLKEQDREIIPLLTVIDRVLDIADGLHHAHMCGVFHHDIQPANLLYDRSHGSHKIIDFARSAFLHNSKDDAQSANSGGMIRYQALELYNPDPHNARRNAASDQFSLAVVACEWLIDSSNLDESPDLPPQQIVKMMKQDLGIPDRVKQVLLKASAEEYTARYPDIRSFAYALRDAVHKGDTGNTFLQDFRRNRRAVLATMVASVLVIGGGIGIPRILTNNQGAEPVTVYTGEHGPIGNIALSSDNSKTAVVFSDTNQTITILDSSYKEIYTNYELTNKLAVYSNEWYKDSQHLFTAAFDRNIYYWEITGKEKRSLSLPPHAPNSTGFTCVHLSPQSNDKLAVVLGNQVYIAPTDEWLQNKPPQSAIPFRADNDNDDKNKILNCAWSPDEKFFAVLCDSQVSIWDVAEGKKGDDTYSFIGTSGSKMAWHPQSASLSIGKSDGTVETWSLDGKVSLATLSTSDDAIVDLVWSPNGRFLAISNAQPLAWVVDFIQPDAPHYQQLLPGQSVQAFAWSVDQGHLSLSIGCTDSTLSFLRFS